MKIDLDNSMVQAVVSAAHNKSMTIYDLKKLDKALFFIENRDRGKLHDLHVYECCK